MSKKLTSFWLGVFFVFLFARDAYAVNSVLSFNPPRLNLSAGQQESVSLVLNPRGDSVVGTDVYLNFNPQFLRLVDLEKTNAFSAMHALEIDNSGGTVKFALSNSFGNYLETREEVATLTIEALGETSQTELSFDYTSGSTTDTNVAGEGGEDLLTDVNSLTLSTKGEEGETEGVSDSNDANNKNGEALTDSEEDDLPESVSGETVDILSSENEGVADNLKNKIKDILGVGEDSSRESEVLGRSDESNSGRFWYLLLAFFSLVIFLVSAAFLYKELSKRK